MSTDLMTSPAGEQALELQSSAGVAKVQAELQAMMMWAVKFPRDEEAAIEKIDKRCQKFEFADAATYELERKDYRTGEVKIIRGLSIDMAEEIQRRFKNIRIETDVISDTAEGMLLLVSGYDLENNIKMTEPVYVTKLIERSRLYDGQVPVSERKNASGKTVYTVRPSDDDFRAKMLSQTHKAKRNILLCLAPSDAQEQWIETAFATINAHAQQQAATEVGRQKLVDSFKTAGVSLREIEAWLKHPISDLTPEEWVHLRGFYKAIVKEGMTFSQAVGRDPERREPEQSTINPDDLKSGNPEDHTDVRGPVITPEAPATDKKTSKVGACEQYWITMIDGLQSKYSLTENAMKRIAAICEESSINPAIMPDRSKKALESWVWGTLVPALQEEDWLPEGEITL